MEEYDSFKDLVYDLIDGKDVFYVGIVTSSDSLLDWNLIDLKTAFEMGEFRKI